MRTAAAARKLTTALLGLFRGALKANLRAPEVHEDLLLLGLDAEKAQAVALVWEAERETLAKVAVESTLTVNRLLDMDWRFGVTASSRSMDRVGATFLQMKLVTEDANNGPDGTSTVNMELRCGRGKGATARAALSRLPCSLQQFYAFLSEMEKAYSALSAFH